MENTEQHTVLPEGRYEILSREALQAFRRGMIMGFVLAAAVGAAACTCLVQLDGQTEKNLTESHNKYGELFEVHLRDLQAMRALQRQLGQTTLNLNGEPNL